MSKIGLALAGGGPGGAVYEIGALRALEEALEGIDFNDLHIYVGVSAGAFLAASLANEITPTQLARAIVKQDPGEHPFTPAVFFTPAYREWARRGLMLPRLLGDALWRFTTRPGDQSLLESLTRLVDALPVSVFDNEPIRRFLERMFAIKGRTDDFRLLKHTLVVVATDVGAGHSIRFGEPGEDHVPISRAVQASTALPGLYPPVAIDGRLCVDGVLRRTLHASVALEHGTKLLFCINPIVPADIAAGIRSGALPKGVLLRRGLPAMMSQTFRTLIQSRLEVGMAAYKARFPDADVLLLQPQPTEYGMFFRNMFSFSTRKAVAELAYQATRRDLFERRRQLKPLLARHGVRLREDVLEDPSRDLWSGLGLPGTAAATTRQLRHALDQLADLV